MLIQFRVENHRSLRDEQVLSLVASSDKSGAPVLCAEGLAEGVVPVAAIYGANASGKSNVLAALDFMRSAVLNSQSRWEVDGAPQEPFLLSSKAREPSLYEIDIIVAGVRYRYGFQLSSARIEEEWLFAWPHGRKAMWFERDGDNFEFGKTLHGENETIRNLTRPNSLFLSAAAQNNHAALLPVFRHIGAWQFLLERRAGLHSRPWLSHAIAQRLSVKEENMDRDAIMHLLRDADTGILDVRVEVEDTSTNSFEDLLKTTLRATLRAARAAMNGQPMPSVVSFRHRTTDDEYAWLPLAAESDGTVALLELAPHIVDTLRTGSLLCVDELEASLHPALALSVVRMFNDPKHNPNRAQLVFATHDTHLLGSLAGESVLHRDQVWFTEKDDSGGTHLYPLTDFHPRKEENLERGYLQGRYGAIPFLGELLGPVAGGKPSGDASSGDAPGGDGPGGKDRGDDQGA